jgi:hypothetical protein
MATEAFTLNLTVLCGGGEITKTGACALASDDSRAEAARSGRNTRYLIFIDVLFSESNNMRRQGPRDLRLTDSIFVRLENMLRINRRKKH